MRQWLVNPKSMCLKHLLGEHVEHHMFVGALKKRKSLCGYLKNNLLEPKSLMARHQELATEIERRGYKHKSPLEEPEIEHLSLEAQNKHIDKLSAEAELFRRCPKCRSRRESKNS